jgi:transposase
MGRSRGRLTTKIHALVDALGLPIAIKLTPAVQRLPSSLPQPRRTLLQQTQALPGRRHPLRKGQRKRPALVKPASAKIWMRFTSR